MNNYFGNAITQIVKNTPLVLILLGITGFFICAAGGLSSLQLKIDETAWRIASAGFCAILAGFGGLLMWRPADRTEDSEIPKPTSPLVEIIEEASSIEGKIRDLPGPFQSLRLLNFNGGWALSHLIDAIQLKIGKNFRIDVCVFDADCSKLVPRNIGDGKSIAALQGLLLKIKSAPEICKASCEYLFQASDMVINNSTLQDDQIKFAEEKLSDFYEQHSAKGIRVELKSSPRWIPGRILIIDDVAFLTLYLQPRRMGPTFVVRRAHPIFEWLESHMRFVWEKESTPLLKLTG